MGFTAPSDKPGDDHLARFTSLVMVLLSLSLREGFEPEGIGHGRDGEGGPIHGPMAVYSTMEKKSES